MTDGCSISRRWGLLGLLLASGTALALPPDQIFDRAAALTWQVRALAADEKLLATASGIAVAPGKLLTSCGALARARQVQLRRGNTIYDAKLEFPDVERDLCQLDAPGLASPVPAPGSSRNLRPGQRLYVIGYGVGNAVSIGEGLVSTVHDAGAANERIQTTIPAARGLLGAGVYDENARLVGMVTASPKEAAATVFAVPADWVPEVAARGQAALAARSKPAAAAPAAGAPGMPAAGTIWVYEFSERLFARRKFEVTVRALRVDGSVVEESVTTNTQKGQDSRRAIDARSTKFVAFPLAADVALIELAPYLLVAGNGRLPDEPVSGAGYPTGAAGFSGWITKVNVGEWEQLTVSAGTFRTLPIQVDGRREQLPAINSVPYVFKLKAWYSPEAKRVVRIEHQSWSGAFSRTLSPYADDTVELLSYRPPP